MDDLSYSDGDVVWVKLGHCWWPGEVCGGERLPAGLLDSLKRQPIAVVRFFQEETFEYVRNINNICMYNCKRKMELIKKGLELYRKAGQRSYMDKFPGDVQTAERMTRGDPDIINDPELQGKKRPAGSAYSDIFQDPHKTRTPKSGARASLSPGESDASPWTPKNQTNHQVRIMSQPSVKSLTPATTDAYKCAVCNFSTGRINVFILHNKTHTREEFNTPVSKTKSGRRTATPTKVATPMAAASAVKGAGPSAVVAREVPTARSIFPESDEEADEEELDEPKIKIKKKPGRKSTAKKPRKPRQSKVAAKPVEETPEKPAEAKAEPEIALKNALLADWSDDEETSPVKKVEEEKPKVEEEKPKVEEAPPKPTESPIKCRNIPKKRDFIFDDLKAIEMEEQRLKDEAAAKKEEAKPVEEPPQVEETPTAEPKPEETPVAVEEPKVESKVEEKPAEEIQPKKSRSRKRTKSKNEEPLTVEETPTAPIPTPLEEPAAPVPAISTPPGPVASPPPTTVVSPSPTPLASPPLTSALRSSPPFAPVASPPPASIASPTPASIASPTPASIASPTPAPVVSPPPALVVSPTPAQPQEEEKKEVKEEKPPGKGRRKAPAKRSSVLNNNAETEHPQPPPTPPQPPPEPSVVPTPPPAPSTAPAVDESPTADDKISAEVDALLSATVVPSFDDLKADRKLPPKERGKRIFKTQQNKQEAVALKTESELQIAETLTQLQFSPKKSPVTVSAPPPPQTPSPKATVTEDPKVESSPLPQQPPLPPPQPAAAITTTPPPPPPPPAPASVPTTVSPVPENFRKRHLRAAMGEEEHAVKRQRHDSASPPAAPSKVKAVSMYATTPATTVDITPIEDEIEPPRAKPVPMYAALEPETPQIRLPKKRRHNDSPAAFHSQQPHEPQQQRRHSASVEAKIASEPESVDDDEADVIALDDDPVPLPKSKIIRSSAASARMQHARAMPGGSHPASRTVTILKRPDGTERVVTDPKEIEELRRKYGGKGQTRYRARESLAMKQPKAPQVIQTVGEATKQLVITSKGQLITTSSSGPTTSMASSHTATSTVSSKISPKIKIHSNTVVVPKQQSPLVAHVATATAAGQKRHEHLVTPEKTSRVRSSGASGVRRKVLSMSPTKLRQAMDAGYVEETSKGRVLTQTGMKVLQEQSGIFQSSKSTAAARKASIELTEEELPPPQLDESTETVEESIISLDNTASEVDADADAEDSSVTESATSTPAKDTSVGSGGGGGSGGDAQILAVPAENFGGPVNSFYLCSVGDDGNLTPINNEPLYLDASNQLVPEMPTAAAAEETEEGEDATKAETSIIELSSGAEEATQSIILNTPEGQQIILDQQSLLALAATGEVPQIITADGQQVILPGSAQEILTAIAATGGDFGEASQILIQEPIGGELTAGGDLLATALENTEIFQQEQLIGGDASVISPTVKAHVSETNAVLTQPPIMSTVEVPTKNGDAIKTETAMTNKNLEDSLAEIGVTSQTLVPTSLELPITVTNPAIAPKATNPLDVGQIYPPATIAVAASSVLPPSPSVAGGPLDYDLFTGEETAETVPLDEEMVPATPERTNGATTAGEEESDTNSSEIPIQPNFILCGVESMEVDAALESEPGENGALVIQLEDAIAESEAMSQELAESEETAAASASEEPPATETDAR